MPTVLRWGGLRVAIYPNDHRPAHVHVIGAGREAVFRLCCPDGPVFLRQSFGFLQAEIRAVEYELNIALVMLCLKWKEIHDDY